MERYLTAVNQNRGDADHDASTLQSAVQCSSRVRWNWSSPEFAASAAGGIYKFEDCSDRRWIRGSGPQHMICFRAGHQGNRGEAAPQVRLTIQRYELGLVAGALYHHIFIQTALSRTCGADRRATWSLRKPTTAFWCAEHYSHAFDMRCRCCAIPYLPTMLDIARREHRSQLCASAGLRFEQETPNVISQRWMGRRAP